MFKETKLPCVYTLESSFCGPIGNTVFEIQDYLDVG